MFKGVGLRLKQLLCEHYDLRLEEGSAPDFDHAMVCVECSRREPLPYAGRPLTEDDHKAIFTEY